MNELTQVEGKPLTGLALLREPFPANQISQLPKPTKQQTEAVRADFKKGIRCQVCGSWHHPDVIHLDYVGHAALTDRLLDADPEWYWEPAGVDDRGLPALDSNGGLWIKLTVAGVTRYGYGAADGKQGGDAMKERIGDALRNAAMRFGAALDLWHKGDLHADFSEDDAPKPKADPTPKTDPKDEGPAMANDGQRDLIMSLAGPAGTTVQNIVEHFKVSDLRELTHKQARDTIATLEKRGAAATKEILDDDVPY